MPEIRLWVNARQRAAVAAHPAGVVVDGRDIGTVVFPEAPLKVFLTAAADERARRRLSQQGQTWDGDVVARESAVLAARDALDAGRAVAPLRPDRDAVMLDTTSLTFDQQVEQIVALAATRFPE
jgi:cytidylate kinase